MPTPTMARAMPSAISSATRKRSPLLSKPSAWTPTMLLPTTARAMPSMTSSATRKRSPLTSKPSTWTQTLFLPTTAWAMPSAISSATRKRSPPLSKPSAWTPTLLLPTTAKDSHLRPLGRKQRLNKHTKRRDNWATAASKSVARDGRRIARPPNYTYKVFPSLHLRMALNPPVEAIRVLAILVLFSSIMARQPKNVDKYVDKCSKLWITSDGCYQGRHSTEIIAYRKGQKGLKPPVSLIDAQA